MLASSTTMSGDNVNFDTASKCDDGADPHQ